MVFCTFDPETQILVCFLLLGRTFFPWEILALERSHVRQGGGAAANTLIHFVVRERGAPQQIHLCTSLSGGGQERGRVRGLRFPTGKKFGPPPKKRIWVSGSKVQKKALQNKGFGARNQPKIKDSVL